ncbi:MAG: hypothetical protein ACRELV_04805 [Longimicrobiales bacterium]
MEPETLAGMIFTVIMLAMIGGFILLLPVSRHLSKYLEERIGGGVARVGEDPGLRDELRRLSTSVHALRDELERVAERQEFTEKLLESREAGRLES